MKICPKCKSVYDNKFKYCKQCGVLLENKVINQKTVTPKEAKDSDSNSTLFAILFVVLLVIAGVGFYYFNNKVQTLEKQVKTQSTLIKNNKKSVDSFFDKQNEIENKLSVNEKAIEQLDNNISIKNNNDNFIKYEAIDFFKGYHRAITNKDYRFAYDCLSSDMKRSLGSYNTYRSGYNTTIYSTVTKANVISVNGNTVEVEYVLEAKDFNSSYDTVIQHFAGTVVLQKYNGIWKIIDNHARKI